MGRDGRALVEGAVGGALATGTMSACMLAAYRAGVLGEPPPRRVADAALHAVGASASPSRGRNTLAIAGHFAFGAAAGALFALVQCRRPAPLGPVPRGLVYASGIWFVAYEGWVPALGIMPPAHGDRPGRPATMLVAHWVYGATLGAYLARRPTT